MSCDKKNDPPRILVVRVLNALWLALAVLLASPAAFALDSGDIIVASVKGEVHFTVSGVDRIIRAGGVLEPPATLRTGRDGAVELRQGATTVSVGPETQLDFPALEKRGAPVDRIVQPRGNAFYNIGKREGRKLRVETPYLVGVVKGTQFSVAALDEAATISLFEGLLEVRATDDSDVIDLKAGEIASRKRGDKAISVMKMEGTRKPTTMPRAPSGNGSSNGTPVPAAPHARPSGDGVAVLVDHDGGADALLPDVLDTLGNTEVTADLTAAAIATSGVDAGVDATASANAANLDLNYAIDTGSTGFDVTAATRVDLGPVDAGADALLNVGAAEVDLTASTSLDAGAIAVDASAAVNLTATSVDLTVSTSVDAGPIAVDAGAGLNVGVAGVDVTTATVVDAGPIAVDVAGNAGVDLAATTIDTAAAAGVDAGSLTTDVVTATAVDLGAGTVGTGVDLAVSTPVAAVDVGASAAVDVAGGTVDVGLTVAGADLDLGLNLGLDANTTPDTGSTTTDTGTDSATTTPLVDVGGLLGGLLRRPGRR